MVPSIRSAKQLAEQISRLKRHVLLVTGITYRITACCIAVYNTLRRFQESRRRFYFGRICDYRLFRSLTTVCRTSEEGVLTPALILL